MIFLISASRVSRITGWSHQRPANIAIFDTLLQSTQLTNVNESGSRGLLLC
jgi:hypothetical protein